MIDHVVNGRQHNIIRPPNGHRDVCEQSVQALSMNLFTVDPVFTSKYTPTGPRQVRDVRANHFPAFQFDDILDCKKILRGAYKSR